MKFFVTLISFTLFLKFSASVIIQTQHGPVQGRIRTSELGRDYFSFQGIPYARPPIGELMFREPQPAIPWTETLDCTEEGPEFWHFSGTQVVGSFDSLIVNVYTNNLTPDQPYPVMVYIHGGGYSSLSSATRNVGPDFLVEKNVTFVSLNYRLGVFGFLSLNDSSLNVPGNAGLKDQRLALRWVQQNIANFGGDPNRVTLFGHSAGGGSTHYHMLSENSRGLFHRGIAMGANAIQNGARFHRTSHYARVLAQRLGFNGDPTSDRQILSFLENSDPAAIVIQTLQIVPLERMFDGYSAAFGPVTEPYMTAGVVLTDNVYDMIESNWGDEIPLLIGQTTMENLGLITVMRSDPNFFEKFKDFENYIPFELGVERNTNKSRHYTEMIRDMYYPVFEPTLTNVDGLGFLFPDADLWFPTQLVARYRLRAGNKAPTFIYRFDADTDYNVIRILIEELSLYRYPWHGLDAMHLITTNNHVPYANVSDSTKKTVEMMTTTFTNFATFGDPGAPELEVHWPAVTSEDELLLGFNINEIKSEVMILPETQRMKVFADIWDTERAQN